MPGNPLKAMEAGPTRDCVVARTGAARVGCKATHGGCYLNRNLKWIFEKGIKYVLEVLVAAAEKSKWKISQLWKHSFDLWNPDSACDAARC